MAGTVLAVALSFVLLTFGSAIGLSIVSFEPREGASLFWLALASGLWFIWVAITSFGAGGYLAGRLRRPAAGASVDEIEVRDGAHGLLVWATGALLGAVLAASGITGVVGAAGRASGTVAQTAAEAVGGDVDYLAERLVRGVNGIDPEVRGAVAATIRRSLASGEFAPQDRDYLAGLLADGTGQSPEEAAAIINSAFAEARQNLRRRDREGRAGPGRRRDRGIPRRCDPARERRRRLHGGRDRRRPPRPRSAVRRLDDR